MLLSVRHMTLKMFEIFVEFGVERAYGSLHGLWVVGVVARNR